MSPIGCENCRIWVCRRTACDILLEIRRILQFSIKLCDCCNFPFWHYSAISKAPDCEYIKQKKSRDLLNPQSDLEVDARSTARAFVFRIYIYIYASQFRATFANRFRRFAGIDFFKGHRCPNERTNERTDGRISVIATAAGGKISGLQNRLTRKLLEKNVSICKRNEGAIFSLIQLWSIDHRASVTRNAQHRYMTSGNATIGQPPASNRRDIFECVLGT